MSLPPYLPDPEPCDRCGKFTHRLILHWTDELLCLMCFDEEAEAAL